MWVLKGKQRAENVIQREYLLVCIRPWDDPQKQQKQNKQTNNPSPIMY